MAFGPLPRDPHAVRAGVPFLHNPCSLAQARKVFLRREARNTQDLKNIALAWPPFTFERRARCRDDCALNPACSAGTRGKCEVRRHREYESTLSRREGEERPPNKCSKARTWHAVMERRDKTHARAKLWREREGRDRSRSRTVGMNREQLPVGAFHLLPDDLPQRPACIPCLTRRRPGRDCKRPVVDAGCAGVAGSLGYEGLFPRVHNAHTRTCEKERFLAHVCEKTAFCARPHENHTAHTATLPSGFSRGVKRVQARGPRAHDRRA